MRVCVFCGSSPGDSPVYARVAADLGRALTERGIGLVYGGGRVGCMGAVADAALAAGGEVIGVIPRSLAEREIAHAGLSELIVVETMHERKAIMAARADAFVALPGGFGTLEELFEVVTWRQLGIHDKPVAVLDVNGYFATLIQFCDAAAAAGFIRPADRAGMLCYQSIPTLLAALELTLAERSPSP